MWIQIVEPMQITLFGSTKQYSRGEWIDYPNIKQAELWIANGKATIPKILQGDIDFEADTGIVFKHNFPLPYKIQSKQSNEIKPIYARSLIVTAKYTSINRSANVIRNFGKLKNVFKMLSIYEVILTLASFKHRAIHVGKKEERERTLEIVGDLRVPYYNIDVFGVRNNKAGQKFCEVLNEEIKYGKELAMLRTLYQVKPITYYLPVNWIK